MKDKIQKKYYRRVRHGNTIRATNSRAVPLVRYSTEILKWTKDELKVMDKKTQKIKTMNIMYHPQRDTDRLYIVRMERAQGLLSIVDCVETKERKTQAMERETASW